MAKVKRAERRYRLYDKLKDIQSKGVGEKIAIAVQIGEINHFGDDSVRQILKTLDKSFKSDHLTIMHQSWSSFIKLRRGMEEKMDDYVDRFERKMAELKRDGTVLPNKVLAMQLIDTSKLSEKEIQIVLTGVNNEEESEMYEQSKTALRKLFWRTSNES